MTENPLTSKTDEEFIEYLDMVASDFQESGMYATAEDYEEMIRRLKSYLNEGRSPAEQFRERMADEFADAVVESTAVEIETGTYVGDTCPRCGEQFKYPGLHECHNQTTKVLSDTSM